MDIRIVKTWTKFLNSTPNGFLGVQASGCGIWGSGLDAVTVPGSLTTDASEAGVEEFRGSVPKQITWAPENCNSVGRRVKLCYKTLD